MAQVPESYHNIQMLVDLAGINEIQYTLSEDLKLHNITIGKQSHSSRHPCSYCNGYYDNKIRRWIKGEPQTVKSLKQDREKWMKETHGNRNLLKNYNNVEHTPIMLCDEDTKILVKIPPPPLHVCLLGPTNFLIHALEKVYPGIVTALENMHLVRENYQGKTFEGNLFISIIIYLIQGANKIYLI